MNSKNMDVVELVTMGADYNPRTISDHEMGSLRGSLRRWGCVEPVVVNLQTNCIVGGHQRVEAARLEGLKAMPVVFVDLDLDNEKALNLALNNISGSWEFQKLESIMEDLKRDGWDMAELGFTDAELADFQDEWSPPKDVDSLEEYDEESETTILAIRIKKMNAKEAESLIRTAIEGIEFELTIT